MAAPGLAEPIMFSLSSFSLGSGLRPSLDLPPWRALCLQGTFALALHSAWNVLPCFLTRLALFSGFGPMPCAHTLLHRGQGSAVTDLCSWRCWTHQASPPPASEGGPKVRPRRDAIAVPSLGLLQHGGDAWGRGRSGAGVRAGAPPITLANIWAPWGKHRSPLT